MYNHALKGFQGKKGFMPAKGGNAALKDDAVKAAVDYMVSQSK
jgi:cytochrome c5